MNIRRGKAEVSRFGLIQELADYEKSQMVLVTADDLVRDGSNHYFMFCGGSRIRL
jgi:NADH:ubiquinone oxidoreductase subunit H